MYPGSSNAAPPSPPETHASYFSQVPVHHSTTHRPAMVTPNSSFDLGSGISPVPMETPTSRFRRGSSIGYISTPGHREPRERNGSVAFKHLVIVVPPPSVAQEHGSLGHTLTNGPVHRLSQGLIMPLLPTMYGQLTAIAKEFNFPSPTGVCLYYCYTEQGITMTPRLSDDIWQTVWGLGESAHANGERRVPIVGKIEFDIDMSQARWYAAWLASRHREPNDFPTPITAPNLQFRGDNRFTFPQTASEDGSVDHQSTQLRSAPVMTRHIPRKLSLMDRIDPSQSDTRTYRSFHSPPTVLPLSSHVLSPIRQQEEPKSARNNLNDRVKSWRASAIVTPPTESEPIQAETVKSPSGAASPASQSSFHLEDYAFSISSAGPDDTSFVGSYHQEYIPSVHMGYRVCGSVGITESYCTSPGPSDSTLEYHTMDGDDRLPSPDIAYRMYEEAALSPAPTATSWGAPSQGLWTLSEPAYSPSIDIAFRINFSAAPSPAPTATSWGAPSYDGWDSPMSDRSRLSIHLCDRGEFSTPPTPQTATSWGAPSCPLSPASPERLPSPDVGHRLFEDSEEFERRVAIAAAWVPPAVVEPDIAVEVEVHFPSPAGVPTLLAPPPKARKRFAVAKTALGFDFSGCSQYPSFVLYAPVYPCFDLYPASAGEVAASQVAHYPKQSLVSLARTAGYPLLSLYETVYPHFEIYPALAGGNSAVKAVCKPQQPAIALAHTAGYPWFSLYLPVYPHFNLYPSVAHVLPVVSGVIPAPLGRPVTTLPAVKMATSNSPVKPWSHSFPYGTVEIPSQQVEKLVPSSRSHAAISPEDVKVKASAQPWVHSWPYRKATEPKPAEATSFVDEPLPLQDSTAQPWAHSWPYSKLTLSENASTTDMRPRSTTQPWGHSWPYRKPTAPEVAVAVARPVGAPKSMSPPQPWGNDRSDRTATVTMTVNSSVSSYSTVFNRGQYPCFILYPSVYPHFDLYPSPSGTLPRPVALKSKPLPVVQGTTYPSLVLYPAVYPFNLGEIYPGPAVIPAIKTKSTPRFADDPFASVAAYPSLCIYRPLYPHNLKFIYPPIAVEPIHQNAMRRGVVEDPLVAFSGYPALNIYRPMYPHHLGSIYPPLAPSADNSNKRTHRSEPCNVELNYYPAMQIYSLVYPHNLYAIYLPPAAFQQAEHIRNLALSTSLPAHYPHFSLYPPVYPHFSLWPINPALEAEGPSLVLPAGVLPVPFTVMPSGASNLRSSPPPSMTVISLALPQVTLQPPTHPPPNRRSGRLTHAELHAMVMMEQRLSLSTQSSTSDLSTPTSPLSPSPVKRAVAVRFEVDVPRKLYSPIRSSTLPPLRFEEPQSELPPVPSSSLSRSSTLPLRRPRQPPTAEAYPGGRSTIYDPENMRARGLGNNTMSRNNIVERRGSTVARRMTIWENGGPQATKSPNPPPTPSIRQAARNRDSLVYQRIKALNSS